MRSVHFAGSSRSCATTSSAMPITWAAGSRRRRGACTTAKSNTARSTARRRLTRSGRCPRRASNFIPCRACRTTATNRTRALQSTRRNQQDDPDNHEDNADRLASGRRLSKYEVRYSLREQDLDQGERAHAGGGRDREGEEPERGGKRPHGAGEQRWSPSANDRPEHGAVA